MKTFKRLVVVCVFGVLSAACVFSDDTAGLFRDIDGGTLGQDTEWPIIDKSGGVVTKIKGTPFKTTKATEYAGVTLSMGEMTSLLGIKTENGGTLIVSVHDGDASGPGYLPIIGDLAGKAALGAFGYLAALSLDPDEINLTNDQKQAQGQEQKQHARNAAYGGDGGSVNVHVDASKKKKTKNYSHRY